MSQTPVEPQYKNPFDFFDRFLRNQYPTTVTRMQQLRWSRKWYMHTEAVTRVSALWKAYEAARRDNPDNYMSDYLRFHSDYHMDRLMRADGVFDDCRREDTPSVPIPVDPMKDSYPAHDKEG